MRHWEKKFSDGEKLNQQGIVSLHWLLDYFYTMQDLEHILHEDREL